MFRKLSTQSQQKTLLKPEKLPSFGRQPTLKSILIFFKSRYTIYQKFMEGYNYRRQNSIIPRIIIYLSNYSLKRINILIA